MSQFNGIYRLLHKGIFVHLRPYWSLHIIVFLAILAVVAIETSLPLVIRYLIDEALIPQDKSTLITALVILFLLFISASFARFTLAVIRAHVHKELYWDMATRLFSFLKRLPLSYFDNLQPGHFGPIFDYDLLTICEMVRDFFARAFQALLQFCVIIVTMLFLNWRLGLLVMVLLPLAILRPQRLLKPSLKAFDLIRSIVAKVNNHVQDYVATQTLTRAFGRGEEVSRSFNENVAGRKGMHASLRGFADIKRTLKLPHFIMQKFKLSMDNHQAALTFLVICAGTYLNINGLLSLGTLSAFVLLLPVAMRAVSTLAEYVHDLGRATLSFDRIEGTRMAMLPDKDTSDFLKLDHLRRDVTFQDIEFGYKPDRLNIRDINLTLPVGKSIAVVGRSGAGKSTLFKLLLGLYEPSSGHIRVDGYDLHNIDSASLCSRIGTVLQTSLMINTSIRNNICFAKPDATEGEMIRAAKAVGIHDFIVALPDGYDSSVGDGGKWLSEGQKQRIALARAILPSPDLLLLDEVTSSLDPENEAAVQAAIRRLSDEKTVMMVTHRLASVTFADHIVVMDQGCIKEQGRHEELLAIGGLYTHLWQIQSGFTVSGDGHYAEVSGERLHAIPLFRSVELDVLDQLAGRFVSQNYQAGQQIYREGEAADKFYILVRGSVSITSRDAGQKIIHLAELQDGDYFGEVEMINKGRRTTSVTSRLPSLVLTLYADQFDSMAEELDSFNKVVIQMALGRSLTMISSIGRRRRSHPVWKKLCEGE